MEASGHALSFFPCHATALWLSLLFPSLSFVVSGSHSFLLTQYLSVSLVVSLCLSLVVSLTHLAPLSHSWYLSLSYSLSLCTFILLASHSHSLSHSHSFSLSLTRCLSHSFSLSLPLTQYPSHSFSLSRSLSQDSVSLSRIVSLTHRPSALTRFSHSFSLLFLPLSSYIVSPSLLSFSLTHSLCL